MIGLGFLITLVNYLDRSALSYSRLSIKQEFGLNDAQFGEIAGAFGVGYMVMVLLGGIIVDRAGAHRVWAASAVLWSTFTGMMGLASAYPSLFVLRTFLGLSEGPHFPSLTRVVADWLPPSERGRAMGWGLAAVPMASVIGAPLITSLIAGVGWKMMFVVLGALGIVWGIVWFIVYRDYPENCSFVSEEEVNYIRQGKPYSRTESASEKRARDLAQGTTTWKFMLFNPSLMTNNFAFFSFGYLLFFAITWLPGYLEMTHHLDIKEVGKFLVVPWLTAAILLAFAGWLSDWLLIRTGSIRTARSHLIWICQLLSALCFMPILLSDSLDIARISLSLGLGFGLMPNAAFYALNTDLAKDRAATSLGIMDVALALAGILAPVITGRLTDATGNFHSAFGLLIFFTLASVASILLFQRPDRDALKPEERG